MKCYACGCEATPTLCQHLPNCAAHAERVLMGTAEKGGGYTHLPVAGQIGGKISLSKKARGLCAKPKCNADRVSPSAYCWAHKNEEARKFRGKRIAARAETDAVKMGGEK